MRSVCWVVVISCLLVRPAAARDIFVDNVSGDDRNNGLHAQSQGDTAGPVRTIAKALRLARAGDRIELANSNQPYRECVALVGTRHSGAARLIPFILDGNGATLDGSAPIPADAWTHFRDNIFRFRPKSLFRPVLFLNGRAVQPLPLPGTTAYPPRLEPLQWCAIEGAVYFAVEANRLPPDYKLSYAELPTGITLYQVDQVVIRNLTIRGFRADGVAAAVGARNIVLDNLTCTDNGQSGVCVGGGAQVEFESCKLAGNGQSQLLTLPNSETHLLASELANDTARGWVDAGGRVYLGPVRIAGGKKSIRPDEAPKPPRTKQTVEKGEGHEP
ncbi:MAG: right-handed parallel beta-helix repeat-containing protein [Thermoguttaceae bacterium]